MDASLRGRGRSGVYDATTSAAFIAGRHRSWSVGYVLSRRLLESAVLLQVLLSWLIVLGWLLVFPKVSPQSLDVMCEAVEFGE